MNCKKNRPEIPILEACAAGRLEGELWQHPWLLDIITRNNFLIEVRLDVNKSSVKSICKEIIDLLEDDDDDWNA